MEELYNNNWTKLPLFKECLKCNTQMRLEAYENAKGEVRYQYECTFSAVYSKCGNIEEVV